MREIKFRLAILFVGMLCFSAVPSSAQSPSWPQRPVKFIVPLGPGSGADIGARVFAEKLAARWGQPVVIENRPGSDSIVAIAAFLSANDDHTFLFAPSGSFTVHPFVHSKLPYDPKDLVPVARASNTILALAVSQSAPYKTVKEFTEAARANPGKFNSGLVSGITEFMFWGYEHSEGLKITQVPYRDINVAPVDLGENRIQVVMSSLAIVQPQWQAGRVRLIAVNNRTRAAVAPDVPTAREAGYPALEVEGLIGLIGIKTLSNELRERIAADFRAVVADGAIAAPAAHAQLRIEDRLKIGAITVKYDSNRWLPMLNRTAAQARLTCRELHCRISIGIEVEDKTNICRADTIDELMLQRTRQITKEDFTSYDPRFRKVQKSAKITWHMTRAYNRCHVPTNFVFACGEYQDKTYVLWLMPDGCGRSSGAGSSEQLMSRLLSGIVAP